MKRILSLIFSTFILLFTTNVFAFNCFETSPNLALLADKYWEHEEPLEVKGDEADLVWLKDLSGRWQGTVAETDCKGTDAKPRQLKRQGDVKVDISERSDALLVIKMEKSFAMEKVTKTDRVHLLVKDHLFSLSSQDKQLTAAERYRQKLLEDKGTRYVEILSDIQLKEDVLTIEWSLFSNGVYAFTQTMTLQRR